jgi:hypothetical protein
MFAATLALTVTGCFLTEPDDQAISFQAIDKFEYGGGDCSEYGLGGFYCGRWTPAPATLSGRISQGRHLKVDGVTYVFSESAGHDPKYQSYLKNLHIGCEGIRLTFAADGSSGTWFHGTDCHNAGTRGTFTVSEKH